VAKSLRCSSSSFAEAASRAGDVHGIDLFARDSTASSGTAFGRARSSATVTSESPMTHRTIDDPPLTVEVERDRELANDIGIHRGWLDLAEGRRALAHRRSPRGGRLKPELVPGEVARRRITKRR